MNTSFRRFSFQEACKLFLILFPLCNCGHNTPPVTQGIQFSDTSVGFSNSMCTVDFKLLNISDEEYVLTLSSTTFLDANQQEYAVQSTQDELSKEITPPVLGPVGESTGRMTFDLTGKGLVPPLQATMVLVGVNGQYVAHFVGNFTCE